MIITITYFCVYCTVDILFNSHIKTRTNNLYRQFVLTLIWLSGERLSDGAHEADRQKEWSIRTFAQKDFDFQEVRQPDRFRAHTRCRTEAPQISPGNRGTA